MNLVSPKGIYKEVLKETNAVLQTLEAPVSDQELSKAIETARDGFSGLKYETDTVLQELDENAEWDALTVALYGETNAGKSTIIETLRILMGEKTKQEQQKKFRQICEKFNIDSNVVETWKQKKQKIVQHEEELMQATSKFDELQKKSNIREQELVSRVQQLDTEINALPYWRRRLSFLWKIPAQAELNAANEEWNAFVSEKGRLLQGCEQEKLKILTQVNLGKNEVADIDAAMKQLEIHQDGSIIGDGQSDFTRESSSYEFHSNGNKFVLIDVPGIEGKEELVREPIMQAVRKAHAVFYVTRKADPPQKGDEKTGTKGTLEKIKEHLSAQTEVWTIFNKSIKSAEQLRTPQLINKGELDSLKVLEDEMCKQLGKNYAGSLTVSAYPAFAASTDHFLPGNVKSKDRSKFLAVMNSDEILQKTGFQALADKLGSDMAENAKTKIRKSNFNKANDTIVKLRKSVADLNKDTFEPLLEKLEDQARASTLQLESATNSLKSNIESIVTSLVKKSRSKARENIYGKIDGDVGNDDFKDYLKGRIKAAIEEVQKEIPEMIKKKIEIFQEEVKDIADQFQEHVQEFLHDASMTVDIDFNLNIKIDNGIKIGGLISTAISTVALIFVSGGLALVVGALGIVISLVKSVREYFSSDYKKSQQRKVADENIDEIFSSIESNYISQLNEKMQKLEENLVNIKHNFQLPAQQAEKITSSLSYSVQQLELVSKKIVKEGGL